MQRSVSRICWLGFLSLVFLLLIPAGLSGCGTPGPKVTLCISDPAVGGFQCVKPNKEVFFLRYEASENYVAMSPQDFKKVIDWMKQCVQAKK